MNSPTSLCWHCSVRQFGTCDRARTRESNESKHARRDKRSHVIASRRIGWRRGYSQLPTTGLSRGRVIIRARRAASESSFTLELAHALCLLSNYRRDPTNRCRGGHVDDDARVVSLTEQRVACRRTREMRNWSSDKSTAEDISSRDCRNCERAPASTVAPAEIWRADWRRRRGPYDRRTGHVATSGVASTNQTHF